MTEQSSEVIFPLRVACVDTGSNAIRFLIADFSGPSTFSTLHYERVPIRLGHQVFLSGSLAPDTIEATVEAFSRFRTLLDEHEVVHFRAVATSAVRESKNGATLVDRIRDEAGIDLEVITGSEEARLVHAAVKDRIDLEGGHWILCDVGGGSVEVSLVDDVGMLWAESHTMGSVRLLEVLSGSRDDPGKFQRLLTEYVNVLTLPTPATYLQPSGFIATGGNIEALADLSRAIPNENGVARVSLDDLRGIIARMSPMSYRDKVDGLGLREDRADVILPAAMVYLRVAEIARAPEVLVPGVGVKEGLLLDQVDDLVAHRSHEGRYARQLRAAAVALGRRFLFDEDHGLHVAKLADSLFRQLEGLHGLKSDDRSLLFAAAVLHDIGLFISYKGHHKHSLYILKQSELPGISGSDMHIVANVARYHRKSGPKPHHLDFVSLSEEDQVRTTHLAGLLRLADALDRQHIGCVRSVQATVDGTSLELAIEGEGDLLLERWAVARKKNVFEQSFGLQVSVKQSSETQG